MRTILQEWRRRPLRIVVGVLLTVLSVVLVALMPHAVHSTWHEVGSLLGDLPLGWLSAISAVWIVGLLLHTMVLTCSLPGLSTKRALSLNFAGSAVANAVPGGGIASMALTTSMGWSWGFTAADFGAFLTVSNLWNILGRLLLGVVGLAWWFAGANTHTGLIGTALVPVVGTLFLAVAVLGSARFCALGAATAGRIADHFDRRRGRHDRRFTERAVHGLLSVRRRSLEIVRQAWPQLSFGILGYMATLCLLLDLCLRALHHPAPLVAVVAAVALERVLTAVPITPGGAGVAELSMAAALTFAGVNPVVAATATLLYRVFTFGLEIPVGLAIALGWGLGGRRGGQGGGQGNGAARPGPGNLQAGTA